MRISLGTAQLGSDYGVSNEGGQPSEAAAAELIRFAGDAGVWAFDTSPAYGASERLIGAHLPDASRTRIITKAIPGAGPDAVRRSFEGSLADLRATSVDSLLVHHATDLEGSSGERLARTLIRLKEEGLTARLGVSVYDHDDLAIAERILPLEVVQVPFNALDQRLATDGTIARLHAAGIEVHARSIFLQGLLLLPGEMVPSALQSTRPAVERFRDACEHAGVSPLEGALGAGAHAESLHTVIVGANSAAELREVLAAADVQPAIDYRALATNDPEIVDPRRWPGV